MQAQRNTTHAALHHILNPVLQIMRPAWLPYAISGVLLKLTLMKRIQ